MIYLFLVETKVSFAPVFLDLVWVSKMYLFQQGLTLEQIDQVFSEPNPRKYSIEHATTLKAKQQSGTA
jgi:hypothetical protein